jgi:hypothetical protein
VLSKLAYLTLCRFIQLLVLLARKEAAKDLEILVLRHQLNGVAPPSRTSEAGARRPCPTRGGQPGTAAVALVVLLGQARDAAALASPPHRRRLDLPTPRAGATAP